jgi:epoxyqueuosine reductase
LYGCDACLDACPPGRRWLGLAQDSTGRADLLDVLAAPDERLRREFGHFYTPRNDLDYLRRNALVALGHCGTLEAMPVLNGYLAAGRPMLRTHAAWALGRLGGATAEAALENAAGSENDPAVITEIETALREARATGRPAGN